jgi:hypothetical protein
VQNVVAPEANPNNLGFVNYHRDHVKDFAGVTAPLYELAHQKGESTWEDHHEQAFVGIKGLLTSPPRELYYSQKFVACSTVLPLRLHENVASITYDLLCVPLQM